MAESTILNTNIDFTLKTTWNAVRNMYQKKALHNSTTMSIAFVLGKGLGFMIPAVVIE